MKALRTAFFLTLFVLGTVNVLSAREIELSIVVTLRKIAKYYNYGDYSISKQYTYIPPEKEIILSSGYTDYKSGFSKFITTYRNQIDILFYCSSMVHNIQRLDHPTELALALFLLKGNYSGIPTLDGFTLDGIDASQYYYHIAYLLKKLELGYPQHEYRIYKKRRVLMKQNGITEPKLAEYSRTIILLQLKKYFSTSSYLTRKDKDLLIGYFQQKIDKTMLFQELSQIFKEESKHPTAILKNRKREFLNIIEALSFDIYFQSHAIAYGNMEDFTRIDFSQYDKTVLENNPGHLNIDIMLSEEDLYGMINRLD